MSSPIILMQVGMEEQLTLWRLCSFSFTSFSRARANSIAETTIEAHVKTKDIWYIYTG
jgi:hypothetical protein